MAGMRWRLTVAIPSRLFVIASRTPQANHVHHLASKLHRSTSSIRRICCVARMVETRVTNRDPVTPMSIRCDSWTRSTGVRAVCHEGCPSLLISMTRAALLASKMHCTASRQATISSGTGRSTGRTSVLFGRQRSVHFAASLLGPRGIPCFVDIATSEPLGDNLPSLLRRPAATESGGRVDRGGELSSAVRISAAAATVTFALRFVIPPTLLL
mmetsp:Transcript_25070/g.62709  ORF Transcript_25070/g.62709 Transcript_25070/m.62709 type:complete len:213 (+) Transcript_25070:2547-3185(+)